MEKKTDIDKLIGEYLELSVELHIADTELLNYPTIHGWTYEEELDEYSPYEQKSNESQKLRNKVSDMSTKLLELGYNPYAMGAKYIMKLYESGDLKKTIDPDTREIKLELLRDRTKRKNSAEEYEAIVMYKNDSEKGSKNPSSLTGLFGGGK